MHHHGTPITPRRELLTLAGRSFCVSFAAPADIEVCHEIGQSVMLDNGAFSVWRRGATPDWPAYYRWCERWLERPTTWAVIPDVIDEYEDRNEQLIREWPFGERGAPVWHMHEPLERLDRLVERWPRVCIGSSAEYAILRTPRWHARMAEAMDVACEDGKPRTWLHMLRGMACCEDIYPFASVDSTDVAQNHNRTQNTARRLAERWDGLQCPARWLDPGRQLEMSA